MKPTSIPTILRRLAPAAVLIALTAPSSLRAQFECNQELMAGAWAVHTDLWILERGGGPDPFPPPGPFSAAGIQVIDAQGRAVVARQTNSTSMGVSRPDFAEVFDTQTTINSDCTGTATQSLRSDVPSEHPLISVFGLEPGQLVFELDMVCANGQSECRLTFTEPASILVGIVKMERIDPAPSLTAADVSSELSSIKANLAALLRRAGIVPQE